MNIEIVKKPLSIGAKEKVVSHTSDDNLEKELDNILENLELDGYIQYEASKEDMKVWDKEYVDWILVCDGEDESDQILVFARKEN